MKTYEINWSEKEKVYLLTRNDSSAKLGCFKSLPQGITLINTLFETYTNQKERVEPLKEYQALFTALGDILKIFSADSPILLPEELPKKTEPEELIEKISEIVDAGYEILVAINNRIQWFSQETIGPFCFKTTLENTTFICIQFQENGESFITSELFQAETFIKQLFNKKELNETTYRVLIKKTRALFSEIASN